jgi:hypothetical protein
MPGWRIDVLSQAVISCGAFTRAKPSVPHSFHGFSSMGFISALHRERVGAAEENAASLYEGQPAK